MNGNTMNTATLSVKGQIVIPKHLRETAQLSFGDELSISYVNGEIRLRPIITKQHAALSQVAGCLARPNQSMLSDEAIKDAIKARLNRKHAL